MIKSSKNLHNSLMEIIDKLFIPHKNLNDIEIDKTKNNDEIIFLGEVYKILNLNISKKPKITLISRII